MSKENLSGESIASFNLKQLKPQGGGAFEIYRVGKELVPENKLFLKPHRRNFYQFVYVWQGNSSFWADLQYYSFETGGIYFTGPTQVLVKDMLPREGIILCFTKEFLQMGGPIDRLPVLNSDKTLIFKPSIKERKELEFTLLQMLEEYAKKDELALLSLISGLGTFLVQVSRLYNQLSNNADTSVKGKIVTEFFNLVNSGFNKHHLVAEYAALLNVTPGHLNELVKKNTGKTALLCIQERIMLEAKNMLYHKTDSIKGIAYSLGFNEAAYFTKFFKRQTGIPPEDFRNIVLEISIKTPKVCKY